MSHGIVHLIVTAAIAAAIALMLTAVGMTFHAILEIGNALFEMLCAHIGFGVFMAGVAGVADKSAWMAGPAA